MVTTKVKPKAKNTGKTPGRHDGRANLNPPWKKGETGNQNGRPKSGVALVIEQLTAAGVVEAKPVDIRKTWELLINGTVQQLTQVANDNNAPMVAKIAAKQILSNKGWEIVNDMLDRAHGKAAQSVNNNVSGSLTLAGGLIGLQAQTQKSESPE